MWWAGGSSWCHSAETGIKAGRCVRRWLANASHKIRTKITTEASETIDPTDDRAFHVV